MASRSTHDGRDATQTVNIISELLQTAQLAWRLLLDPRVPLLAKALIPVAGLLYFLLPIDLLPDVIPVLGQLDDLAVLMLLTRLFIALAPAEVVAEHQAAIRSRSRSRAGSGMARGGAEDVVDGEYRIVDDD